MNKLIIVGNLTRDPETRSVGDTNVCSFTVAVSRKRKGTNQPDADFFRVSAWRGLGDICQRFLSKGGKVLVTGPVSVSQYAGKDGTTKASLEMTAEDVEFLSGKSDNAEAAYIQEEREAIQAGGSVQVNEEDLPF